MKKANLVLVGIMVVSLALTGCGAKKASNESNTQQSGNAAVNLESEKNAEQAQNNKPAQGNVVQNKGKITVNDFSFTYKGVTFNDTIPFEDIMRADALKGISNWYGSTGSGSNSNMKAESNVKGVHYQWHVNYFPNEQNKEFKFEHVSATYKDLNGFVKIKYYLVSAELLKVPTKRGISVGDSLDKLKAAYGDTVKPEFDSETTDVYDYKLNSNSKDSLPDKTLSFIVDKKTKKVIKIWINYNNNKAMDEMDITSFD